MDKLKKVLVYLNEKNNQEVEKIITEMSHPDFEMTWDDHEGEMANSELMAIAEKAEELSYLIDEDDELDAWVQSKITKAKDYITSVHDYIMYHSKKGNDYE